MRDADSALRGFGGGATNFKVKRLGLDNLLDEVDQFLTEIISQQWALHHANANASKSGLSDGLFTNINSVPIVRTSQTMFPRSRVQPLTLGALNEWASTLRAKVRLQIMEPETDCVVSMPPRSPLTLGALAANHHPNPSQTKMTKPGRASEEVGE